MELRRFEPARSIVLSVQLFQSNHNGIETEWVHVPILTLYYFNRTIMELRLASTRAMISLNRLNFNRTIMELRHLNDVINTGNLIDFNRTIMELRLL